METQPDSVETEDMAAGMQWCAKSKREQLKQTESAIAPRS